MMGAVPFALWYPGVNGQWWRPGPPGYVGRHRLDERLCPQSRRALRRARRRQKLRKWGLIR